MKSQLKPSLLALGLFGVTAAAVIAYPSLQSAELQPVRPVQPPIADTSAAVVRTPVIEAVFVLDTTGSMGGLIQSAKDRIWSIASTMAAGQPAPEIRIGLVAYRDRGDDYVTRVVGLSRDLDGIQGQLMQFQAQGGGDGPESVNQALADALHRINWSQDPGVYRVIFLVGDAPAHLDYQDDVPFTKTLAEAKRRGIRVNAIQCGQLPETAAQWRQIAQLGDGSYFQVEQNGGAVAVATPYDEPLARLSAELDATRLYYGASGERAAKREKLAADAATQAAASPAARARRAEFVASKSGAVSLLGDKELVEEVSSGRVDLDSLPAEQLPAPLATLSTESKRDLVAKTAARRADLRQQIQALSVQRAEYLKRELATSGGGKDTLDHKIFDAVRKQSVTAGLKYEQDGPSY